MAGSVGFSSARLFSYRGRSNLSDVFAANVLTRKLGRDPSIRRLGIQCAFILLGEGKFGVALCIAYRVRLLIGRISSLTVVVVGGVSRVYVFAHHMAL